MFTTLAPVGSHLSVRRLWLDHVVASIVTDFYKKMNFFYLYLGTSSLLATLLSLFLLLVGSLETRIIWTRSLNPSWPNPEWLNPNNWISSSQTPTNNIRWNVVRIWRFSYADLISWDSVARDSVTVSLFAQTTLHHLVESQLVNCHLTNSYS